MTRVTDVFLECQRAIDSGVLITRPSESDKEFHFQNWFEDRLQGIGLHYEKNGRNSYPDFFLLEPEGYELKGLAFPGRTASFDSNSQVPSGLHNGRTIYYVFGRYPKNGVREYPVIDLVMFHGDFLNAHHDYSHENKSLRGFGTYGDILIRDRKMYVVPTPFALTHGTTGLVTLILPEGVPADERLQAVGALTRVESERLLVGYHFDLETNELKPDYRPNPAAGTEHRFMVYRAAGASNREVGLVSAAEAESIVREEAQESAES